MTYGTEECDTPEVLERRASIGQRPPSSACRFLQGPRQNLQEPLTTPQHRPEVRQMLTVHLTVHKVKMPGMEALHEVDKGDFRRIRPPGKH